VSRVSCSFWDPTNQWIPLFTYARQTGYEVESELRLLSRKDTFHSHWIHDSPCRSKDVKKKCGNYYWCSSHAFYHLEWARLIFCKMSSPDSWIWVTGVQETLLLRVASRIVSRALLGEESSSVDSSAVVVMMIGHRTAAAGADLVLSWDSVFTCDTISLV